jgi:hypothetical protein
VKSTAAWPTVSGAIRSASRGAAKTASATCEVCRMTGALHHTMKFALIKAGWSAERTNSDCPRMDT